MTDNNKKKRRKQNSQLAKHRLIRLLSKWTTSKQKKKEEEYYYMVRLNEKWVTHIYVEKKRKNVFLSLTYSKRLCCTLSDKRDLYKLSFFRSNHEINKKKRKKKKTKTKNQCLPLFFLTTKNYSIYKRRKGWYIWEALHSKQTTCSIFIERIIRKFVFAAYFSILLVLPLPLLLFATFVGFPCCFGSSLLTLERRPEPNFVKRLKQS